jgi:hypothetical protein
MKSNAKKVNLSLVARELPAPPDGKPHNTLCVSLPKHR